MKSYGKLVQDIDMIQIVLALGNTMQLHECNNHDISRALAAIEPK
jgi:hypothetical protein